MNLKDFDVLVAAARQRQDALRNTKGQEYIKYDADQLANFKRIAESLGIDPLIVWVVYASKHWDSILSFVKKRVEGSEPIVGRIDDLGNYLHLLEGLLADERTTPLGMAIPVTKEELESTRCLVCNKWRERCE